MQWSTPWASTFQSFAEAIHAQLIQELLEVRQSRRVSEQRTLWATLESGLLDHMRWEAELLLPDFDLVQSSEAARIREEHELIRQLVMRLSDASSLARLDDAHLAELLSRFRACAALEERALYPWAEVSLRWRKKADFLQRSRSSIQQQLGSRGSRAAS